MYSYIYIYIFLYIYIYVFIYIYIYIYSYILIYIKISKNLSAKYYQENKEILQKNLSTEENLKKQQHGCERYKNLTENKSFLSIEKKL